MTYLIHGSRWSDGPNLMLDPISEEEARAAYEKGDAVCVACGRATLTGYVSGEDREAEPGEPAEWTLFAELARDVVVVEFFNFWGTREATYTFRRQPDGRLFLVEAVEYEFEDLTRYVDGNAWSVMEEHSFDPDGTSSVTVYRARPDGSQDVSMTEYKDGDFSAHWEPVPTFGDWTSLTRRQR